MRLNFYSRRRRFNKSLLGSHKNSFTPFIHKKALRFKNFFIAVLNTQYLSALRVIILFSADIPVPCFHGFFSTWLVLLRQECLLVRSYLAQVHLALVNHSGYGAKALALCDLTLSERSAALGRFAHVDAVAIGVGGCRGAVGA